MKPYLDTCLELAAAAQARASRPARPLVLDLRALEHLRRFDPDGHAEYVKGDR